MILYHNKETLSIFLSFRLSETVLPSPSDICLTQALQIKLPGPVEDAGT